MPEQLSFDIENKPPIKGFPELRWTGKRPFKSTVYYPAQLRERYGAEAVDGWINRIYWGDNLQVMSHLMKDFRGKIDLIYIDPPFDSKADYKKKINLHGQSVESDSTSFEEKQYGDIWTNDEYLQFMYERLLLMRELLTDKGSIYIHCDWHKSHYIRAVLDEVFGLYKFLNEIVWYYRRWNIASYSFSSNHDTIFYYCKSSEHVYNQLYIPKSEKSSAQGKSWKSIIGNDGIRRSVQTDEPTKGVPMPDVWEISMINPVAKERTDVGYPTQKPESLLERIIKASTNPGDLVFDCFMGSGTTQAVAMKLGRRFIGADINLGAIQTTTKRLLGIADAITNGTINTETNDETGDIPKYTGFEVYNVNNYDFFRNPIEAKQLLIDALEIQAFPQGGIYDGEKEGRMVKIMPVNRIATKADLEELKANLPYGTYENRVRDNPSAPAERITIVCMGHEPDLQASLEMELSEYKIDIQVCDVLHDRADLTLKREAEADIAIEGGCLVIRQFYPLNLMQKLSLQKEYIEDWRQLVESIMIDWNYDGAVMEPAVTDIPGKTELVEGIYEIPDGAGTIKVKITDLLSESLETEVRA